MAERSGTYFDLRFVQLQRSGDLDAPCPGKVFVEVEFFLQFSQLFGGEVGSAGVVGRVVAASRMTCRSGVGRGEGAQ